MKEPTPTTLPPRDKTAQALLALAEYALGEYFSDPDQRAAYAKWLRATAPSRKRTGAVEPSVLWTWELDGGGAMLLAPLPVVETFMLGMHHPKWSAAVTARYTRDTRIVSDGDLKAFGGSKKAARDAAEAFLADREDDGDTDALLEEFMALGIEATATGAAERGSEEEPPPLTAAQTANVQQVARTLAMRIGSNDAPDIGIVDHQWLERHPRTLWPILDGYVAAAKAEPRNAKLLQAYNFLLLNQLELIRYRQERGWDWAVALLAEFQQRIIAIGNAQEIAPSDWFELAAALSRAKVPVTPEVKLALAEAGASAEATDEPDFAQLRAVIDQFASAAQRPFDVIEAFGELGAVLPAEVRSFMVLELALSPHVVLRDSVPLMLLDADAEFRRLVAAALEQTAARDTMSPDALRRLIAVRNWLPETDRPAVDRIIRKARASGVECAQWPQTGELTLQASAIDGSGAQSIIGAIRSGRKGVVAGLLLKQGFGIRDTWTDQDTTWREITANLHSISQSAGAVEVDRSYLDIVVQHMIAVALAAGNVPAPTLLDVAETLRGADWQDRRLDIPAEAEALFLALDPAKRTERAIAGSLARGPTLTRDAIAKSWFEDGPELRAVIASAPKGDKAEAIRRVLAEVLPAQRGAWAERFLLMALWARAAKAPAARGRFTDFAILAHALSSEAPLADIPIMKAIADRSVFAARAGVW